MSPDGSERVGWRSPLCLRWYLSLVAAGGAGPSCSPLAPWKAPPARAGAAGESWTPQPCSITPRPGLSAPQPPAPLQGRQQRRAVSAPLMAVPSFLGSAWPPTAPHWGCRVLQGEGGGLQCCMEEGGSHTSSPPAQPWGTMHMCVPTCAACVPVPCLRGTRTHTCALSACVLCCEIPLPVQAVCLSPSPCAGPAPGTIPGHSHPWDPLGSKPQWVPTQAGVGGGVPTVPTSAMTALCTQSLG